MQTLQPELSGVLFMKRSGMKKRERKAEMSAPNNNLKIFSRVEIVVFDDDINKLSFCHFRRIYF